MIAPWPVGTDSGENLRGALREFVKKWLADPKYRVRLPRQHLKVLEDGGREGAGICIRIISQGDPKPVWPYEFEGHEVAEDWHQVAIVVKADRKAGGAESVSAVFGALRALFASREGAPERAELEQAGLHECLETPEGLIQDGDEDEEGTFFKQQINLRCNTDTFLN